MTRQSQIQKENEKMIRIGSSRYFLVSFSTFFWCTFIPFEVYVYIFLLFFFVPPVKHIQGSSQRSRQKCWFQWQRRNYLIIYTGLNLFPFFSAAFWTTQTPKNCIKSRGPSFFFHFTKNSSDYKYLYYDLYYKIFGFMDGPFWGVVCVLFYYKRHVADRNVGLSPMQIYLCGSLCIFSIHSFPTFFLFFSCLDDDICVWKIWCM